MTPPAKTFMGSKINCFQGSIALCRRGSIARGFSTIVFFLNIYNNEDYSGDFSGIPYAYIRMYEGTPTKVKEVFAQYDVSTKTDCVGMRGLILGKLYRRNGEWKFNAIGDAFPDKSIVNTIARVIKDYSR